MKIINVESLAGRCGPSSDFVSNRWQSKLNPLAKLLKASRHNKSWKPFGIFQRARFIFSSVMPGLGEADCLGPVAK
jgi:hypothetical protein